MAIKQIRGILSTALILSGLVSLSSGIILYFLKYGMWFCFTRKQINDLHVISGLIMGVSMIIHFILNRHIYSIEMKAILPNREERKE